MIRLMIACRSRRAGIRILSGMLLALVAPWPTASQASTPEALAEGNRLFRDGRLEEAVSAYLAGYSPPHAHPTLAYNLGTALHHLDRLPEAILWYRRAQGSDDTWLDDNLLLARRGLGSQNLPPGGLLGTLSRFTQPGRLLGIVLAWIALLLTFLHRPLGREVAPLALLALVFFGSASIVDRWGPQPAVMLQACETPAGILAAGTEAWVRRLGDGRWQIAAAAQLPLICPAEAFELVEPPRG